jgi:hypothetical protein
VKFIAGEAGLGAGSVCAGEVGVVKDLQALNADEFGLEAEVSGQGCDKGEERNRGEPRCTA